MSALPRVTISAMVSEAACPASLAKSITAEPAEDNASPTAPTPEDIAFPNVSKIPGPSSSSSSSLDAAAAELPPPPPQLDGLKLDSPQLQ